MDEGRTFEVGNIVWRPHSPPEVGRVMQVGNGVFLIEWDETFTEWVWGWALKIAPCADPNTTEYYHAITEDSNVPNDHD